MELTKLSTKGQVVIPERLRQGLEAGTAFEITRRNDLIILKRVKGLTEEERREMEELEELWKEVDEGKCKSYSVEEFFEKLRTW